MKNKHNILTTILVFVVLVLFTRCATQTVRPEVVPEIPEEPVISTDFPIPSSSWSLFDLHSNLGIGMYDLKVYDKGFSIYIKTETAHSISKKGEALSYSPFEGYFEGAKDTYKGEYLIASDENQRYFVVLVREKDDYILSIMDDSIFTEFSEYDTEKGFVLEELKPFIRTQVRLIQ